MANKNILLIEPGYKNKYPPLGLMKIAQYHGPRGKKDRVRFIKGPDRTVLAEGWDRIYITTLFSFEYRKIAQTIDFALEVANGLADRVFVGGIAASLMHERFLDEPRWRGVRFIKGLLSAAPAISLQLDDFAEELYADDVHGKPIEDLVPDYSILEQVEYKYPVWDAYFAYTTRGCIRKCRFCGVPKLEGQQRDTESLSSMVRAIEDLYGQKRDLILMDTNVGSVTRLFRCRSLSSKIRDPGDSCFPPRSCASGMSERQISGAWISFWRRWMRESDASSFKVDERGTGSAISIKRLGRCWRSTICG